jgi:hypothetical protein
MDLADFMGPSGIIENPLRDRGFARVDMGDNADIAYVLNGSSVIHTNARIVYCVCEEIPMMRRHPPINRY